MRCTLLAIVFDTPAVGGMTLAHHHEHGKEGVKTLSRKTSLRSSTRRDDGRVINTRMSSFPNAAWSPRANRSRTHPATVSGIRAILRQNASAKVNP